MAKVSGGTRASRWVGDIYSVNGQRKEYYELPQRNKDLVKMKSQEIARKMYRKLKDEVVHLNTDKEEIEVGFTKKGIDHVSRDAMIVLSGKYLSETSMMKINEILAKSKYVETNHQLYKDRSDGKSLFFKYEDSDGRGLYFEIAYEERQGSNKNYYLYSVVDK